MDIKFGVDRGLFVSLTPFITYQTFFFSLFLYLQYVAQYIVLHLKFYM